MGCRTTNSTKEKENEGTLEITAKVPEVDVEAKITCEYEVKTNAKIEKIDTSDAITIEDLEDEEVLMEIYSNVLE